MTPSRLQKCLSVFIGLAMIPVSALAQKWTFSLGGAYVGGFDIGNAPYTRTVPKVSGVYVEYGDSGTIAASPKGSWAGTVGVMFSFSKNWGISAQFGYLSAAQVDITTTYKLAWTFSATDDTGSYSATRQMKNTGDISASPLNVNLVWTLHPGKNTLLNISAGPSFVFAKVRLYSEIGSGVSWSGVVDVLKWKFAGSSTWNSTTKTASVVDYYLLKLGSETKETATGFNAALELEQKISGKLGLYAGAFYCSVGEKEAAWKLNPQVSYQGVFGNLESGTTPAVTSITPMRSVVNFTHFFIQAGVKLHL